MTISPMDHAVIRDALLAWRADGVDRPLLPVHADIDGDGTPDFYGLGTDDELVIISGASLEESVALSSGAGVEGSGDE